MGEGAQVPQGAALPLLGAEGTGFGANQLSPSRVQLAAGETLQADALPPEDPTSLGLLGADWLVAKVEKAARPNPISVAMCGNAVGLIIPKSSQLQGTQECHQLPNKTLGFHH